jgi:hypothetical protein
MSIEEQINEITRLDSIEDWDWYDKPLSYSFAAVTLWPSHSTWLDVDLLIFEAPPEDCFKSKSKYIVECKKWFLSQSLEDNIRFIMKNVFNLESYPWQGQPNSLDSSEDIIYAHFQALSAEIYGDNHFTDSSNRLASKTNYKCIFIIDKTIANADDSLALTSQSEYIRQCKKWFIDHERDILSNVIYYNKYRNSNLD